MSRTFAAFSHHRLRARGPLAAVVQQLHPVSAAAQGDLLLLDEATGRTFDIDWRGSVDEVLARAESQFAGKNRGRPRLGVEGREITLLPGHWAWLDAQGRSPSATLRQLLDRAIGQPDDNRATVDALYRQMSALAGDLPQFEEAARQLYASRWDEVERITAGWAGDLGGYFAERIAAAREKKPR